MQHWIFITYKKKIHHHYKGPHFSFNLLFFFVILSYFFLSIPCCIELMENFCVISRTLLFVWGYCKQKYSSHIFPIFSSVYHIVYFLLYFLFLLYLVFILYLFLFNIFWYLGHHKYNKKRCVYCVRLKWRRTLSIYSHWSF